MPSKASLAVGLKSNTKKMEAMVFLPGLIRTYLSMDACNAQLVNLYQEKRYDRQVSCQECGKRLTAGSIWSHLETQHEIYLVFALHVDDIPSVALRRLVAVQQILGVEYRCPIPGCLQGEKRDGGATHSSISTDILDIDTPPMRW